MYTDRTLCSLTQRRKSVYVLSFFNVLRIEVQQFIPQYHIQKMEEPHMTNTYPVTCVTPGISRYSQNKKHLFSNQLNYRPLEYYQSSSCKGGLEAQQLEHWTTIKRSSVQFLDEPLSSAYYTWMGDCLRTGKPSRYITNINVNSAFHPSGEGKSSAGLRDWD